MKYNQSNYRNIFKDVPVEYSELHASEVEPSLSECIQKLVFGLTFPSQLLLIRDILILTLVLD